MNLSPEPSLSCPVTCFPSQTHQLNSPRSHTVTVTVTRCPYMEAFVPHLPTLHGNIRDDCTQRDLLICAVLFPVLLPESTITCNH